MPITGNEPALINYRGFIIQKYYNQTEWVAWLGKMPSQEKHWFRADSLTEVKKQIDKSL